MLLLIQLNPWRYSLDDAIFLRDAKKHQKESQQQLTYEEPCDFIKENSEIGSEKDGSVRGTSILLLFCCFFAFLIFMFVYSHLNLAVLAWCAISRNTLLAVNYLG